MIETTAGLVLLGMFIPFMLVCGVLGSLWALGMTLAARVR